MAVEVSTQHTSEKPTEDLRAELLRGLTPFDEFSAAIDKHPKTLAKMNPPTVRIGRSKYVPTEEGRRWVLNGCKPLQTGGGRQRRRG